MPPIDGSAPRPFLSSTAGNTVEYVGRHPDVERGDFQRGTEIIMQAPSPSHTVLTGPEDRLPVEPPRPRSPNPLAEEILRRMRTPLPRFEPPTGPTLPLRREPRRSPPRIITPVRAAHASTTARSGEVLNELLSLYSETKRPSPRRHRAIAAAAEISPAQTADEAGLTSAATRIQAAVRGHLARTEIQRLRTQRAEEESLREFVQIEEDVNREEKAECIQRAFRCHRARNHLAENMGWILVNDPAAGVGNPDEMIELLRLEDQDPFDADLTAPLALRVSAANEDFSSSLQNLIGKINRVWFYILLILIPVLLITTPLAIAAYQSGHISIFSNMLPGFLA